MNEVYILDSVGGVLMTAKFKESHLVLMATRGWIKQDEWLFKDKTVNVMYHTHLEQFIQEAD